jgi:hypothetical protein
MPADRDHYEIYYADKLWALLPAVYRASDTDQFDKNGPLREMVNRIGAQAAVLRRSIDRLWADQSIETCDDWVIPYIADLLATNLVASLDARGQRLDVAKTIYYRRRKGTVAILEEIAHDITGWDARVVEFFRRMGRTRHSLDPEVGPPERVSDLDGHTLLVAEGLVGERTGSTIGGWADLRNVYGASKTQSAFDEFFHTADFRYGRGMVGWHNIPRLGVFLWRLQSFGMNQVTPVAYPAAGKYTFDPTGREIPLFAAASRTKANYGDHWVSPEEWQLPTRIETPLLNQNLDDLYGAPPKTMAIFRQPGSDYLLVSSDQIQICPETGRFIVLHPPANDVVFATYHYGFSSTIGAGPFDRRVIGTPANPTPAPDTPVSGGGTLTISGPDGTTTISDSLTYSTVNDLAAVDRITLRSANGSRPLIRLAPNRGDWKFVGTGESVLVLDGIFVSGGDIVLQGDFASVTLTCCTLDPGSTGTPVFAQSADGRDLSPCRVWVEGQVRQFTVDRSICGPIRTRNSGLLETLTIDDSILQAISTGDGLLTVADVKDPGLLVARLRDAADPFSEFLLQFSKPLRQQIAKVKRQGAPPPATLKAVVDALNGLISGPAFAAKLLSGVRLSKQTVSLQASKPKGPNLLRLNRLVLNDAFPFALADAVFSSGEGLVQLNRTTIFGPAWVHQLEASNSILDGVFVVDDYQHGCVRFTAWDPQSIVPKQYESVQIPAGSAYFGSRMFGQPEYGQLLPGADALILAPDHGTVLSGAEDGSEMGAFSREKNPIKERSLLIKFDEFMPLGLVPVIVYVT